MSAIGKVIRGAGVVGASTFISRVFGLVRDVVMAHFYGTGLIAEAFYVAFMIPNLFRRMMGEGSLTVAFISVFSKLRQEEGEEGARRFAATFWLVVTVILALVTIGGMFGSRQIVWLFTNPEYRADAAKFELAVFMTRELFPYLFLVGLVALSMGILNTYKHFFAPAFAPVLLNLALITAVIMLHDPADGTGLALIAGVLAGGVLQLALQLPFLWRISKGKMEKLVPRHPAIRRIGALMLPSVFTVGIVQINTLVANYFITRFDGARSQFYYSTRLTEFPYAIFTLAIATAVLPYLSEQAGRGNRDKLVDTLGHGLRLTAFIMIPATVGLALVSGPLIQVIFEHGSFSALDTRETRDMLIMACVGMWAAAGLRIVVQSYYAVEDMVTPMAAAVGGLVLNLAGCVVLSRYFGRAGIPLAISIATIGNLAALYLRMPEKVGRPPSRMLGRTALISVIACVPMAILILGVNTLDLWSGPGNLVSKILALTMEVGGGIMLYFVAAWLLKAPELAAVKSVLERRLKKK